jgi:hypothetical protein
MLGSVRRGVPYHRQQNWFYCGAASAQMVLESLGVTELSQDDLYRQTRDNSVERSLWRSPPDGMAWMLNARRALGSETRFAIIAANDAESQARWLVWYLHRSETPPIVLVETRMHWLVVCSYEASAAPASPHDTTYRIDGFVVNDPWPPQSGGSGQLHANGSHSAGTGCPNQHIAYSTWLDRYATRVDVGRWKGKHLAVCDVELSA